MADVEQVQGVSASAATRSVVVTYSEATSAAPPTDVLGQTISRYYVRRLLGEGGMGQVYLARDIVIGRSVALKIISGAVPTERLLREASTTGNLNHPHIVQLYDFGAYERGMFLALEYVDGETLRERIRRGKIGLDEALRHTRAIADGLTHAHAADVFHCDLKPSNVMVGRDGRVRVVDFGIARTARDGVDAWGGTEGWMAPEQQSGTVLTDRVDIWALALVCAQLLTGTHPFGDDPQSRREAALDPRAAAERALDHRDLPAAIVDLIYRSLARQPRERPAAAEWTRVLDDVLRGHGDAFTEDGPYPGLAAFDELHSRFYFGREREIDKFVELLRESPHVPIIGPSGAGKSSFLHAGVIPRLRARERWTVISLRPGDDPIGALARRVVLACAESCDSGADASAASLKSEVQQFRSELMRQPARLAARLATLASASNSRVLLAVDQLEEAFTQCASEHERAQFLASLLGAADDALDPVRVVFTVRDDFLGKVAGLRSLFVIEKLDKEALRATIGGPLERYGYGFDDPEIVDDLIAEVASAEVADLPLLQFACRTLWEGRDTATRQLRRATYRAMGGLGGALAQHAERALATLAPEERRITRQLLLQLVSGSTRRSVAREQLVATAGPGADMVVDRLLDARLLVERRHADGDVASIEITHESLLQTWSQLARWVDESRDERRLLEELQDATSLWARRGKRSDETWPQRDIATARHRASQLGLVLPPAIQAFFAAGDQRHRAAVRKRRARYGVALATATSVAVVAFTLVARYLAREQLIRINAGTIDLVLQPFDWINGAARPVAIEQLPQLSWKLHAVQADDPNVPGAVLPPDVVAVLDGSHSATQWTWRIRAPGGMAFLEIEHRGRTGELCPASWIRLQAIPGYAGAEGIKRFELPVPTCQVTRADMVSVVAGQFIYGGPGEQPSSFFGKDDYTEPERTIDLAEFAMDRTEVSNFAFAPFSRLERITGYRAPLYSNDVVHLHDSEPDYPVSEVDAYQADAYCHFLGKQLPSDYQWVKAARGGIYVNGERNPHPRRLYPWGPVDDLKCANRAGLQDGYRWTAPVTQFACGASPYGILNLVGNADEWISRAGQTDARGPLYAMRGGSANSPIELDHVTTIFRNHRDPLKMEYGLGFRCVSQASSSSW
jgi:formylglycine-generating enzyme required for sulfatase activity